MKTSFLAILTSAAYFVSAQVIGPVSITGPLEGTRWSIGKSENVTWEKPKENLENIQIDLMKGDPNALTFVQTLASDIDASTGSTTIEIPQNVTEGSDYSLAISVVNSVEKSYIGGIIIENSAADQDANTEEGLNLAKRQAEEPVATTTEDSGIIASITSKAASATSRVASAFNPASSVESSLVAPASSTYESITSRASSLVTDTTGTPASPQSSITSGSTRNGISALVFLASAAIVALVGLQ